MFFLVERVYDAIENLSSMLIVEELFGCQDNCVVTHCEEERMKCLVKVD